MRFLLLGTDWLPPPLPEGSWPLLLGRCVVVAGKGRGGSLEDLVQGNVVLLANLAAGFKLGRKNLAAVFEHGQFTGHRSPGRLHVMDGPG